MTLDSLLAVAGLLLAAYAIMPRARQLDIQLRVGALDWFIAIVALLVVHYFQFHAYFEKAGLTLNLGYEQWGLTPEKISYIVLLVAALLIGLHVCRVRLTPGRVPKFFAFAQELMWAGKYHDVALVLERHLGELMRICQAKTRWLRWRAKLLAPTQPPFARWHAKVTEAPDGKTAFPEATRWAKLLDKGKEVLAGYIPSREKEIGQAREFCIQALTHKDFVAFLAKGRPYLGLDIIKAGFYQREEFLTLYMNALLRDTSSVLYHEIKNNESLAGWYEYDIPEENRVLHTLVADAKFAEKLAIYRPVGEYMIRQLDELSLRETNDPYNLPMYDFHDDGRWTSSLWIGIRFFDIMVTTALHEGIEWHMWLYYFDPVTERICKNYGLDSEQVDAEAEWPTRYSYLLYEMFSVMTGWVSALRHIPLEQSNVKLASIAPRRENGNIPKSGILALSQCLKRVLVEQSIPVKFRQYLLETVLRLYFNLREEDRLHDYAEATRNAIGLCTESQCHDREEYYRQLIDGIDKGDWIANHPEQVDELREFVTTESMKDTS